MKDNKPLIFINSAQTEGIKDQNQYVYDSRFDKKNKRLSEIKKQENPRDLKEDKPKEEKNTEPEKIEEEPVEIEENKLFNKKLLNKMELLNKRANLERYVLVSVETIDKVIEGYFMKLLDKSIIINSEDEEIEVLFKEIKDIIILKV